LDFCVIVPQDPPKSTLYFTSRVSGAPVFCEGWRALGFRSLAPVFLKAKQVATTTAPEPTRRDFIYIATGAVAAIGAGFAAWPFVDQMNPTSAVLALSSVEIDISAIQMGQQAVFMWRSKPVFVRRRTPKEIAEAAAVQLSELPDKLARNANLPDSAPATAANRDIKPEWLVLIGICTHLGCIPLNNQGDFGGYLCPCHGSQYDTAGRIRKGPAPENLYIPPYAFLSDTKIKIG
jgi:ubiquinol-cytochrome c reductase iron-sulfur subunit